MTEKSPDSQGIQITIPELERYACKYYHLWSKRSCWILDGTQAIEWVKRNECRYTFKFDLELAFIRDLENHSPSVGKIWLPVELLEYGNLPTGKFCDKKSSVYETLDKETFSVLNEEDSIKLSVFILFGYLLDKGFRIENIKEWQLQAICTFLLWNDEDIPSLNDKEAQKLYKEMEEKLNNLNKRVEFTREDFQAANTNVYDCFSDITFSKDVPGQKDR